MSSKRNIRRSECLGKDGYGSETDCWEDINYLARRFGMTGMRPYCCRVCGAWHKGHKPKVIKNYRPGANAPKTQRTWIDR